MKEKVTNTAVKPQFIRLKDGSLMNINNIVAISEDDSDVFVLGYKSIPITEEDMAAVLGNIEIIDNDGHQHHCGQDADDACCQARNNNQSPATVSVQDPNESQPVDLHIHHCGQDATRLVVYGENMEQLIGSRVRLFHAPGHKCDECPYKTKPDGSTCNYHKVETTSGYYICLAKPQQEEPKRLVISFDEDNDKYPDDIMARIKERADDFMDYLDSVVKG